MKKRFIKMGIASVMLIVILINIVITNVTYAEVMAVKKLSMDESYQGEGYSVKVNGYEVLDRESAKPHFVDEEVFNTYEKNEGDVDGIVLVYVTVKVEDLESMSGDWWTNCIIEADNAWSCVIEFTLAEAIKGADIFKRAYENGGEYNVVLPYSIQYERVTKSQAEHIMDWNFRMLWSQNPIVYTNLD